MYQQRQSAQEILVRPETTIVGNWIVSCRLAEGNPYDGHTLKQSIVDVESYQELLLLKVCEANEPV